MSWYEYIGQECELHADCGTTALGCFEGICDCNPSYGYTGPDCSKPTIVTRCLFILALGLFLFGTLLLYLTFGTMKYYGTLEKINRTFTSVLKVFKKVNVKILPMTEDTPDEPHPHHSDVGRPRRKMLPFNCKDVSLVAGLVFAISCMLCYCIVALDFSFLPSMPFQTEWQPMIVSFQLFSFTMSHLTLGLGWMETVVVAGMAQRLSSWIVTHFKQIKTGINLFLIFETLSLSAIYIINGARSWSDVERLAFTFWPISPVFCITLGWKLSKEMLGLQHGSASVIAAGKQIRIAAIRISAFDIMMGVGLVSCGYFMYKRDSRFNFLFSALLLHGGLMSSQLSVLIYLDSRSHISKLLCIKKATQPRLVNAYTRPFVVRPSNGQ
mmetsp:Transcript_38171/g.50286  ORF Transcript_38171/g.50286 Transcript_38171/m.50286 type:complete len:382 (-) Transcript_38171:91-1236(-)